MTPIHTEVAKDLLEQSESLKKTIENLIYNLNYRKVWRLSKADTIHGELLEIKLFSCFTENEYICVRSES